MYRHGVWVALGPAVHRKIQKLGLFALQFIPADHIRVVLTDLGPKSEFGSYKELCDNIEMLLRQGWSPDDLTQFYSSTYQ